MLLHDACSTGREESDEKERDEKRTKTKTKSRCWYTTGSWNHHVYPEKRKGDAALSAGGLSGRGPARRTGSGTNENAAFESTVPSCSLVTLIHLRSENRRKRPRSSKEVLKGAVPQEDIEALPNYTQLVITPSSDAAHGERISKQARLQNFPWILEGKLPPVAMRLRGGGGGYGDAGSSTPSKPPPPRPSSLSTTDVSGAILPSSASSSADSAPSAPTLPDEQLFPRKLHQMLNEASDKGFEDIVAWGHDPSCFNVHKKKTFEESVLPKYFKMTKYKSFTRQLHNYDFQWIRRGPDKGGYRHDSLSRDGSKIDEIVSRKNSILFTGEGLRSTTPTSYDFLTQELEARATGKRPAAATHNQGDLHPEAASTFFGNLSTVAGTGISVVHGQTPLFGSDPLVAASQGTTAGLLTMTTGQASPLPLRSSTSQFTKDPPYDDSKIPAKGATEDLRLKSAAATPGYKRRQLLAEHQITSPNKFHPREDVGSLQQLQGYQELGANIWMAHQHNDSMTSQGSGSIPRSSLPPMAYRDDHYFVARLRDPDTGRSSQTHGKDELFGVQTLAANEASPHDRKQRAEATLAPAPASQLYVAHWEAPSHAQDVAVPSANASGEFEPRPIEDMLEDASYSSPHDDGDESEE